MSTLLAFDPGKRTGIVEVYFDATTAAQLTYSEDVPGGVQGYLDWYEAKGYDDFWRCQDYVVAEDFIYHGRPGADVKDPLEVLGALHAHADVWNKELVLQQPAGRKVAVPDEAFERLGWTFIGKKDRNVKEAARHALVFLRNCKHMPTIKAIFGGPDVV